MKKEFMLPYKTKSPLFHNSGHVKPINSLKIMNVATNL
jgi:hypothetical protein